MLRSVTTDRASWYDPCALPFSLLNLPRELKQQRLATTEVSPLQRAPLNVSQKKNPAMSPVSGKGDSRDSSSLREGARSKGAS